MGISSLLAFEWMRNALLFFGSTFFYSGTQYLFDSYGIFQNGVFFSAFLGILCLLVFEWLGNALIFF